MDDICMEEIKDMSDSVRNPNYKYREIEVREPLAYFAYMMEKVLSANDHKGGWESLGIPYLLARLDQERDKLLIALHDEETAENIRHECCDIANLAMMIFDNFRSDKI